MASPIFFLDLLIHFFQRIFGESSSSNKSNKLPERSFARGPATESHGAPRSSAKSELQADFHGAKTVYEMIQASVQKFGSDQIAMEFRKFVDMKRLKKDDKFPTKIFDDASGLNQITYKDLGENIVNFGKGLREIGMNPIPNNHDPDNFDEVKGTFKMVLFEGTCPNWTTALQGAFSQSMVVATCYATLGHDAVVAAVQELEATAIMVNWKDASVFMQRSKEMPSLKAIIVSTNEMPRDNQIPVPQEKSDIRVVSTDAILEMGKASTFEVCPPRVRIE